ncbi:ThiF family adenylyltransferase [Methylohalobius crimeensis]|uniref:ThiF family adenylyltransferase n=1 Tax=Methylohalobius crimeensis TaxID=244365 RepID=UPI0003B53F2F|nr:ThiF family adenylyltransferase [Methylohalobius crimeensis]
MLYTKTITALTFDTMNPSPHFRYFEAFSRNLGWITATEQKILRTKHVAIAGMGGVGGSHLLTLARLGVGAFHIADFDVFELANFNRQAGATVSHIGRPKVEVLAEMALDINPELQIHRFPEGVTRNNLAKFFAGMDLYVDGLDFFAFDARRIVFDHCAEEGIPAITAAPLGMGVALLNFLPGGMTFEEYFRLEGQSEDEQILRFLLGLSPRMLQTGYLADPTGVDLAHHKGPSTPMACELCAGAAATEALKILLHRGPVKAAPWGMQFDAYRNRWVKTWRPGGNRNPLQKLALTIARKQLMAVKNSDTHQQTPPRTAIEEILDAARWAPSGDNTQPWRFELIDDRHLAVHAHDTRDWCVYDLEGRASQLAVGALLESIAIAASQFNLKARFERRPDSPETRPVIDVYFEEDPETRPDPLYPYLPLRSVNRRPYRTRPLSRREIRALEKAVGDRYRILWLKSWKQRWQAALLMFRNAKLRLTMPEAYKVHSQVIEWNARFSEDKIPDQSVGLDPLALKLMRWAMVSWERVKFLNKWLAGTWLPRIELDFLPGIFCAAHFALVAGQGPKSLEDYLQAGRALQRFWLTAASLGLQLQPEMTPLIFSGYVQKGVEFTQTNTVRKGAQHLAERFQSLYGDPVRIVFAGRIGDAPPAIARSLRRSMDALRVT